MKMQDKKVDDLFQSKLNDFESQPSPNIWKHIENELDNEQKRRIWIPILSIAASVIGLFSFVVILIQFNKEEHRPNGMAYLTNNHHQNNFKITPSTKQIIKQTTVEAPNLKSFKVANNSKGVYIRTSEVKSEHIVSQGYSSSDSIRVSQDEITMNYPVKVNQVDNLVSDSNTKFINVPSVLLNIKHELNTPEGSQQDNQFINKTKKTTQNKIRNLGGLINALVAKVDKRKDKFIEFTESDEGSNITELNLGIFKIKKPKPETDK